jgi:hypothetical protein
MEFSHKTLFVPSSFVPAKAGYKSYSAVIDGVSMSTDINAAIIEMEEQGYEFVEMESVTSANYYTRVYTEGMLLVFKKNK